MQRLALTTLERWQQAAEHLPLLIRGARQVGKTWLVREHAKSYANFVEINLESDPEYISIFKENFGKTNELVNALTLLSGKKIEGGKTLLFIDEIQQSKEALLALRYLKEKLPELHVIAAGSLLEFAFADLSFPVGRIEFFHLFPMNFEEYLMARGRDDLIAAILAADEKKPLVDAVHQKLVDEVTCYCLTGGLPAAVAAYVQTGDFGDCQNIQQRLVASFREDFHKYASKTNIEHLRIIFNDIPRQIGQKFKYSAVDPQLRSRDLSAALGLLEMAGLAYKAHHSSANGLPLGAQIQQKKFKVFFLDIGLAHRILGLNLSQLYLERRELLANRGAMAEQFVAQELLSHTSLNQSPQIYYWHRETKSAQAEVDLLYEYQSAVLPIEVKSGTRGHLKSLQIFLTEKEKFVKKAIKVSAAPFAKDGIIYSLPFYALLKLERGLL